MVQLFARITARLVSSQHDHRKEEEKETSSKHKPIHGQISCKLVAHCGICFLSSFADILQQLTQIAKYIFYVLIKSGWRG